MIQAGKYREIIGKDKQMMCIVSMRTMTQALRAQRVLSERGIRSEIVSLDATLTKNGCAYGLQLMCRDVRAVERILKESGIKYGEVLGA